MPVLPVLALPLATLPVAVKEAMLAFEFSRKTIFVCVTVLSTAVARVLLH